MSKTIYLLRYNNYFNRTIKYLQTLKEYLSAATLCGTISNMTLWNPNDGVDTQITTPLHLTAIPDYMIEVASTEGNAIVSRWFVVEAVRITKGQYRLRLHRDLIADNLGTVLYNENTYVERGWVSPADDEIYNMEPFTFDQIKQSQTKLFDMSGCPWVVIYLTQNKGTGDGNAFPDGRYKVRSYSRAYTDIELDVELKYSTGNTVGVAVTRDAPYAILTMPYGGGIKQSVPEAVAEKAFTTEEVIAIARALSVALSGAGWIMDIQLVPFCPCPETLVVEDGAIKMDVSKAYNYSPIYDANHDEVVGALVSCQSSTFDTTIMKSATEPLIITVDDIKVETNSRFYRLCAPNFNGTFEFDPAKMVYRNGQTVGLHAYCTYIPYQPYIRVAPEYARLYGGSYQDPRGLICSGDLSLPQISDSWTTYQIQNKNYQTMFNRQIQSMDLQHKAASIQDVTGAISGSVSGVLGGIGTGALAGGPVGAIVGGVVGGVASVAGGVADVAINKQLRADERSAAIDQHNMSLQNIQALPQSISNMSVFNIDSPRTVVLEMYDGSQQQISNFKAYLNMYGYTINKVAPLAGYCQTGVQTYLRGRIIRIDLPDDAHFTAALADEVAQGFYYTKEE